MLCDLPDTILCQESYCLTLFPYHWKKWKSDQTFAYIWNENFYLRAGRGQFAKRPYLEAPAEVITDRNWGTTLQAALNLKAFTSEHKIWLIINVMINCNLYYCKSETSDYYGIEISMIRRLSACFRFLSWEGSLLKFWYELYKKDVNTNYRHCVSQLLK
jgi:hypothetical protein